MSAMITSTLWVSLKVATTATLLGLIPATLLGYWLATRDFPGKSLLSALCSLPLVVPPTAVGYLLLRLFAVDGPLGRDVLGVDLGVLMTWRAAVIATGVMSFPLIVKTTRVAFEAIDPRLSFVAETLGHSPAAAFLKFTLPLCARGIAAAAILGFTRALGEFGATVTIAGNITGKTSTLASGIWSAQEMGARQEAHLLIGVAMLLGLVASVSAERLASQTVRRPRAERPGLVADARAA